MQPPQRMECFGVESHGLTKLRQRSKAESGIDKAAVRERWRHIKRSVRKSAVINGAVLVNLARIDKNETPRRCQVGAAGMPQRFYTADHDGDDVFFVVMSRKTMATTGRK